MSKLRVDEIETLDGSNTVSVSSLVDNATFEDSVVEDFYGKTVVDDKQYSVTGWLPDSELGGGVFVGRLSQAKSTHDGEFVISPTVPPLSQQAGTTDQERKDNYRAGAGETDPSGFGVFVKTTPTMNIPVSGNFWVDVQPNAKIHRINDRILLGAATENEGLILTPDADWLSQIRPSTTGVSQLSSLSTIGHTGLLGASRSSDYPEDSSMATIGIQFWGINDNTSNQQTAYGLYGEARRNAGTGNTQAAEINTVNYGNVVDIGPYNMYTNGLTANLWLGSGAGETANNSSCVIGIYGDTARFQKGIIFAQDSLEEGFGKYAIEMAQGQSLRWVFDADAEASTITSTVTSPVTRSRLNFSDTGVLFRNGNNVDLLRLTVSDASVNGLILEPGTAGQAVNVGAIGSDATINLNLTPKGTGRVNLNVDGSLLGGSAGAQFGYVTVQVNGGDFKIPLYNMS